MSNSSVKNMKCCIFQGIYKSADLDLPNSRIAHFVSVLFSMSFSQEKMTFIISGNNALIIFFLIDLW